MFNRKQLYENIAYLLSSIKSIENKLNDYDLYVDIYEDLMSELLQAKQCIYEIADLSGYNPYTDKAHDDWYDFSSESIDHEAKPYGYNSDYGI